MSELLEHIEIEVNILVLPEVGATKTDFKGEAVDDIEFFPQGNTCSAFTILLHSEAAILKGKEGAIVLHEHWEDLLSTNQVFAGATVNEDILLATVPMEVAVNQKFTFFFGLSDKIFGVVNSRVSFSAWLDPLTVKVSSEEIAAVVAVDNTVHVEHWNDLEDEVLSESSCHRIVAQ